MIRSGDRISRGYGLLRHFFKLHGSLEPLKLKSMAKVPPSDLWPKESHGFALRDFTYQIRRKGPRYFSKNHPKLFDELQSMGFVWDPLLKGELKLLKALHIYKQKHGDLLVPKRFVVPKDDPLWSKELWDMKLGGAVFHIRCNHSRKKLHPQLVKMGFDFNYQVKRVKFEDILQGLVVFKSVHGHYLVPRGFKIDENDTRYPMKLRGFLLGNWINNILWRGTYGKGNKERLESIGFHFKRRTTLIVEAVQSYERLYGHKNIPFNFVVPHESKDFPEATWGMRLGISVRRVSLTRFQQSLLSKLQNRDD